MTHGETMDSKDPKMEKVVLNRKQLCAGIQFLEDPCYAYFQKLGPDGEASKTTVLMLSVFFEQMTKKIWQRLNNDDEITLPLEVPDLEEDGGQ